jgi:hypothetical protein
VTRIAAPALSVVVNTMGRLATLRDCVAALRRQADASFDLTIVIGPESEDTSEWLAREAPDIRAVDCPLANLAVSRNLGWRHASGDLIAFIDDDAMPLPRWLTTLAIPFADPRVGAAGGFVRDHTGARHQWQYLTIDPLCNPIEVRAADYRGPAIARGPLDPKTLRYTYPAGTNMMFRRAALQGVGGFDETYAYAADDAELTLRLYDAGWHVATVGDAEVLHAYAPSHQRVSPRIPRALRDTVRSFVHFKLKHGRPRFGTEATLRSVGSYVTGMRGWVNTMEAEGSIDATHAQRLRAHIAEGAQDAVRRSLAPQSERTGITEGVRIESKPMPFSVVRALPRTLRLCLAARELPPAPSGGIGIWVATLGRALGALGHEVHLVAEGAGQATMEWRDGCWVHRAPTPDYGARRHPDLSDLPPFIRNNAWRLFDTVARLEAQRPLDFVCAPIWEAQGIAVRRGRRGPDAVSLHTPMATVIRTSSTWKPDDVWMAEYGLPVMAAEAEVAARSSLVLANSEAVVDEIERAYHLRLRGGRLAIVPHGVDDPGPPTKQDAIRPLRRLLFVGRFEGRKGIDLVLAALPGLMTRHRDLIANLVGEHRITGTDGRTLLDLFRAKHANAPWLDRVQTPGAVDDAKLLEAYRQCDVFVAPSRFESFGLIYIEAMRFGKPVVALASGGAREIVRDGETGILLRNEDPAALGAAVSRLLDDPEARDAMGEQARLDYEKRFTSRGMAEALVEAIMRQTHARLRDAA